MLSRLESQHPIYCENKPRVTAFRVHSGFTKMAKSFGDLLREQLEVRNMRAAELARRSGITKQGIGRLLNNTPHAITGAPPQPEAETVRKIAKAIDWDVNEALLAAGYAPSRPDESHDILEGVTVHFQNGADLTPEEREKLMEVVRTLAIGIINERRED